MKISNLIKQKSTKNQGNVGKNLSRVANNVSYAKRKRCNNGRITHAIL